MFCVYFTWYRGDKLPKRYIGSSSIKRVYSGYNGSLKSKKYKEIYREEQIKNKLLFKTRILSIHPTQKEAVTRELELQLKYRVIESDLYSNMSYATINGFFGNSKYGEDHPNFGKAHTEKARKKVSDSLKKRYADGDLISPFATMDFSGEKNGFFGKTHSENTKNKMRKPKAFVPKWKCPHCEKHYDGGNLKQHLKRNGWSEEAIEEYKINNA